jgi:hypothetical protein
MLLDLPSFGEESHLVMPHCFGRSLKRIVPVAGFRFESVTSLKWSMKPKGFPPHILAGGHRGFEILHVAVALLVKAQCLLTFDENQKKLAVSEGLTVPL